MAKVEAGWYETVEIEGKEVFLVPKVLRNDVIVPLEIVEARWPFWTPRERVEFAGAFSRKAELSDSDQMVVDFLMKNGGSRIWTMIALLVTRCRERDKAVDFLLSRIKEGVRPLANYYQAVGVLSPSECLPILRESFLAHRQEVTRHPSLQTSGDRFIYLDYLSCAAALLTITGQEEYRASLVEMRNHRDDAIRQMALTVVKESNININAG